MARADHAESQVASLRTEVQQVRLILHGNGVASSSFTAPPGARAPPGGGVKGLVMPPTPAGAGHYGLPSSPAITDVSRGHPGWDGWQVSPVLSKRAPFPPGEGMVTSSGLPVSPEDMESFG